MESWNLMNTNRIFGLAQIPLAPAFTTVHTIQMTESFQPNMYDQG